MYIKESSTSWNFIPPLPLVCWACVGGSRQWENIVITVWISTHREGCIYVVGLFVSPQLCIPFLVSSTYCAWEPWILLETVWQLRYTLYYYTPGTSDAYHKVYTTSVQPLPSLCVHKIGTTASHWVYNMYTHWEQGKMISHRHFVDHREGVK